jgi:signal transduction histidine kinase/ligand-binding sensor protein
MSTKFEQIIDNPTIFKIILDEFFHDWPGSYDVMPVENHDERFFKNHEKFAEFCQKVRSKEEGNKRCMGCDIEFSRQAKKQGKPKYYMCHAGLMDIAVPIIVGDELIATIFCGQSRPWDERLEEKALALSSKTEKELGLKDGELLELRAKAPIISLAQIEDLKSRLWEVATYVSRLGSSKLEAEKARRDLAYRLFETEAIQEILLELSGALYDVETFWKKLENALDKICQIVGASFGLFATCEKSVDKEGVVGKIKSSSAIPRSIGNLVYLSCSPRISQTIAEMQPSIIDVNEEHVFFDFLDKFKLQYPENNPIDKIAIIPVRLDPENLGAVILFLSKKQDVSKSLDLRDELSLLSQTATQIATVYGNCVLYERQKELANIQSEWLENVSHQIIAPINGILGQAENLSRYYKTWQKNAPHKIDNTVITLTELADWANRMARNFAWVASATSHPLALNLRLEDDLLGKLIGYARNVQGAAKARGIYKVHVDIDSVKALNNRVVIDSKMFKQAITNLLDNAVKYSNFKTEVSIESSMSKTHGYIYITNFGIPLTVNDVDKIFDRYYRTEVAKERYVIGSGIGLEIAREIMRMHGGDLIAKPSMQTAAGWKTTFVVSLPLK